MDDERLEKLNNITKDICKSVEDTDTVLKLKEFVIQQSILNDNLISMVETLTNKMKKMENIIFNNTICSIENVEDIKIGGND